MDSINILFERYIAKTATPEERLEFQEILKAGQHDAQIKALLDAHFRHAHAEAPGLLPTDLAYALVQAQLRPVRRLWPRIAAAASILLICSAGGYLLLNRQPGQPKPEALLPASNGITLTVAGQQPIPIAYHHTGRITPGTVQQDSLLTYTADQTKVEQQTLTNNSGHRISLQLADGTEAILDVASSLSYPSAFTGKERRVTLNGQAYFKVKHDARHPFFVDYAGQTTEDIGTEFNIHAYANEPASTTLINGRIKVNNTLLKPGEQLTDNEITQANIEAVTAWLQDQMILHNEKLENIMRDVARIYQVSVVWQYPQSKQFTFVGFVSRNKKLASMLNFMRRTGQVDFRVEGKTIYVIKPDHSPVKP
jgi:ferric-dicitrate binding protein FerR (iron transport regulator)